MDTYEKLGAFYLGKVYDPSAARPTEDLKRIAVRPRKSDLEVRSVALLWTPHGVDSSGIAEPLCTV